MSSFRTTFPPFKADFEINHQDQILALGSCFADHIGGRLEELKFPIFLNPFGILYNPISIWEALHWLDSDDFFSEDDLFEHLGLWHSLLHHGQFSHPDKETALLHINQSLEKGRMFLRKTSVLMVTLGTANVFEYLGDKNYQTKQEYRKVVANCHKLPGSLFKRGRFAMEGINAALHDIYYLCRKLNPEMKIIFTVSPIRHIRDGLVENQRSKAALILAVEKMVESFPDSVFYFPSYEIVLDDLRDYRFFKEDMIHPNDQAINYVWEYFENAFFSEQTKKLNQRISKIKNALNHRPIHPTSEAHLVFLKNQLIKIDELEKEYKFLNFSDEKDQLGKK